MHRMDTLQRVSVNDESIQDIIRMIKGGSSDRNKKKILVLDRKKCEYWAKRWEGGGTFDLGDDEGPPPEAEAMDSDHD
jgi:hypothetical protein